MLTCKVHPPPYLATFIMITCISGQAGEGAGVNYVEETTETRYILKMCDTCRFGR
jgi:hypothetical protein